MFSAMQMLTGGVLLLTVGTGFGERVQLSSVSLRSVVALGYLIVFGSVIAFSPSSSRERGFELFSDLAGAEVLTAERKHWRNTM